MPYREGIAATSSSPISFPFTVSTRWGVALLLRLDTSALEQRGKKEYHVRTHALPVFRPTVANAFCANLLHKRPRSPPPHLSPSASRRSKDARTRTRTFAPSYTRQYDESFRDHKLNLVRNRPLRLHAPESSQSSLLRPPFSHCPPPRLDTRSSRVTGYSYTSTPSSPLSNQTSDQHHRPRIPLVPPLPGERI